MSQYDLVPSKVVVGESRTTGEAVLDKGHTQVTSQLQIKVLVDGTKVSERSEASEPCDVDILSN